MIPSSNNSFPSRRSQPPPIYGAQKSWRQRLGLGGKPQQAPSIPGIPSSHTPLTGPSDFGSQFGADTTQIAKKSGGAISPFRRKYGALIALAGVLGAGWFTTQSYRGNRELWEQKFADHHSNAEMDYLRQTWGHDSGHPFMDQLEHRGREWQIFGPGGVGSRAYHTTAYVSGIWNDVILSNIVPIAIAIASIYIGFGVRAVHSRVGAVAKGITPRFSNAGGKNVGSKIADGAVKGVSGTAKGFWSLFKGGRAWATIPILALGLFGYHQFKRVWTHQAQEDRFRGWIAGTDH